MNFNINRVKIFVTIPIDSVEKVKNANPYLGEKNRLEIVEEEKLEFVCDIEKVKRVIQELRKAHPYEEPAIDIIPLIDESEFK